MIVVKDEAMEKAVMPVKEVSFFYEEGIQILFVGADHEWSNGLRDGQTMLGFFLKG